MTTVNFVAVTSDDQPRYFCGLWQRRGIVAAGEANRLTKGIERMDKSLPGADLGDVAAARDGHGSTGGALSNAFGAGAGLGLRLANY